MKNTREEEMQALNDANDDTSLIRFEFIEALIRIAEVKYVRPELALDIVEGLSMLIEKNLWPNVSKYVRERPDPNTFRRTELCIQR